MTSNRVADNRRRRLKELIEENEGYDQVTARLGISRATLSRLVNAEQRSSRDVTDDEARSFERAYEKPDGWLDSDYQRPDLARFSFSLNEEIPPRSTTQGMKAYGETLFFESWSHRLRTNAIRHQGLFAILNISVWRTGWISVSAKGRLSSDELAKVVENLCEIRKSIDTYIAITEPDSSVRFPQDTMVVGKSAQSDAEYLINPHPAPASSLHSSLINEQLERAKAYGDMVAVFQISKWGDWTIRTAFSGFPYKQDAEIVSMKLAQLSNFLESSSKLHASRGVQSATQKETEAG